MATKIKEKKEAEAREKKTFDEVAREWHETWKTGQTARTIRAALFDVAKDEGLPNKNDIVVAHTWWFTIFGLATLMVIQGVVPDLPDQTLVVEHTIATLWAGVQAVPRLPKSAISKRSGRSRASKQ